MDTDTDEEAIPVREHRIAVILRSSLLRPTQFLESHLNRRWQVLWPHLRLVPFPLIGLELVSGLCVFASFAERVLCRGSGLGTHLDTGRGRHRIGSMTEQKRAQRGG